jgi:hypothetical protein
MIPLSLLLFSVVITGLIVFLITRLTGDGGGRRNKPLLSKEVERQIQIEDDFLEDVGEDFEGTVYKSTEKLEKPKLKTYPACFGTLTRYNTCKRDCNAVEECSQTVNILKGF